LVLRVFQTKAVNPQADFLAPTLRRLRKEDQEFKASLATQQGPISKKKKKEEEEEKEEGRREGGEGRRTTCQTYVEWHSCSSAKLLQSDMVRWLQEPIFNGSASLDNIHFIHFIHFIC
jgi:hypothetical protein